MQSALRSVPGVESTKVDFDKKTAVVSCRGACDPQALIAALQKQGFDGKVR